MADAGRVVIPAGVRKALGLKEGAELIVKVDRSTIHLTPLVEAYAAAKRFFASLAPASVLMSEEIVRERRLEAEKEE
jgi:AbrB family looped-hinge helix DNA binding protein